MAKTYVGIVDTLGLDSFALLDPHIAFCMQIRAQSNPHRHACMFTATFDSKLSPEEHVKKIKDPWDMWSYVQLTCKTLKCDPKDAKTIKNIKKLADSMKECTGTATGFNYA